MYINLLNINNYSEHHENRSSISKYKLKLPSSFDFY
jgi:hypothetical protein